MSKAEKKYRILTLETSNYEIQVAHSSETAIEKSQPICLQMDTYDKNGGPIQSEAYVAASGDSLTILTDNSLKEMSIFHLNEKTLAETQFRDILRDHRFALIPHDESSIAEVIETTLRTISEISPGMVYHPISYLNETLPFVNLFDYIKFRDPGKKEEEQEYDLKDIDPLAASIAMMEIFGYFKVKRNIDPFTGLAEPERLKDIHTSPKEISELSERMGVDSSFASEVFRNMIRVKQLTYDSATPQELVKHLKKPKHERTDRMAKLDLVVEPAYVAIALCNKFGLPVAMKFLQDYFREDISLEREIEGRLKKGLTGDGSVFKTTTQVEIEEAAKIVNEYVIAQKRMNNNIPPRIIEANLDNMNLSTGLHFYQDLLILDPKGILPMLAEFDISIRKKEGGFEESHYFLRGREVIPLKVENSRRYFSHKKRIEKKAEPDELAFEPLLMEVTEEGILRYEALSGTPEQRIERINQALEKKREKAEKGKKTKLSIYGGEMQETRQLRLLAEHPSLVDAIEELRRKGDFVEISPIEIEAIDYGREHPDNTRKINFDRVFKFAKYGVVPESLCPAEIMLLSKLENVIETFKFEYEPDRRRHFMLRLGNLPLGEIALPNDVSLNELKKMTLVDAISKRRSSNKKEIETAELFFQIYAKLPEKLRLSDEELTIIENIAPEPEKEKEKAEGKWMWKLTEEEKEDAMKRISGKIHKSSIHVINFNEDQRKRYKVRRKPLSESGFEELGTITLNNPIENIDGKPLEAYRGLNDSQKSDLLELTRAKFSGIEYQPENGNVWIMRRQKLDEFVEGLYQIMGRSAKETGLELSFIRLVQKEKKSFYEKMLGMYRDRIFEDDEKKELTRRMREGLSLTHDEVRRMVLQAKYIADRGLVDAANKELARFLADAKIEAHEGFLAEICLDALKEENVSQDLINFLKTRLHASTEEKEELKPEEKRLLRHIRTSIIRSDGSPADHTELLKIMGSMHLPPQERERYFMEMKDRYGRFMLNFNQWVDELPEWATSIFQDSFYIQNRTKKEGIRERAKMLTEEDEKFEKVRCGFDGIVGPFGINYETFASYVRELARMEPELRKHITGNMASWQERDGFRAAGLALNELNQKILGGDVLVKALSDDIIRQSASEEVDIAFSTAFGAAEKEEGDEVSIEKLFRQFNEAAERIEKEEARRRTGLHDISDEDMEDLFGPKE